MLSFHDIQKIDAHIHFNTHRRALLEQAAHDRFTLLTINTEVPEFPDIFRQQEIADAYQKGGLWHLTTFSISDWGTSGWQERVLQKLHRDWNQGAAGVKVWKNIGMALQDETGRFIMIDDASFDPVFNFLEKYAVPLLGHLGEPKNCWLPVEEMTIRGDRDYFSGHPEYHMYKHPKYPSYEQQLAARDRRLQKHPGLLFIGAHLASLEWSVDKLAVWLDQFPKAAVDVAERLGHLQYQAVVDYDKVRAFLIKYQDRIMYGTDVIDDGTLSSQQLKTHIHKLWERDWYFFQSNAIMNVPGVPDSFKGMQLPDEIMKKIFRDNALHRYPSIHL